MTSCDFKVYKERKKREACHARSPVICAPEAYYGPEFQTLLRENRRQNQWIFNLIADQHCPGETVYHSGSEWLLARDLHRGTDNRYLVIFKDEALHSIRDLRAKHIDVLREVVAFIRRWLRVHEPEHHSKYHMYFHYMPSVFQLHMHVSMRKAPESYRAQHVHHILRNLGQHDAWYRDALILCQYIPAKSRFPDHNKFA
jgi:hypothetical protein